MMIHPAAQTGQTGSIDSLALGVAHKMFGFNAKAVFLAAYASGALPYAEVSFGIETPREDYLRVLDGYTRALSM